MSRSTDYVGYTCTRVGKQVKRLDLDYLAALVSSGDLSIEEALLEAAKRGADTAQLFGAEQVRAAFDAYIIDVEAGKIPAKAKIVGKYAPIVLGDGTFAEDLASLGRIHTQLVGDKYFIVESENGAVNAGDGD
jgi:hypothetical protein